MNDTVSQAILLRAKLSNYEKSSFSPSQLEGVIMPDETVYREDLIDKKLNKLSKVGFTYPTIDLDNNWFVSGFGCYPVFTNEMILYFEIGKTSFLQTFLHIIAGVMSVIRFVEHSRKVLHHSFKI